MTTGVTVDRSQQILDLCDAWVTEATKAGGLSLGGATEQHRLLNNGFVPHEMTYAELIATCLGLTRVLIHPGLNTVIDHDHFWFWAWCAELLTGEGTYFSPAEQELRGRFELACRASLARAQPPTQAGFEKSRQVGETLSVHAYRLLLDTHQVLTYLAFPLLEGLTRKACAAFVDYSGQVLTPFRHYKPTQRCSNLGHMLHLLRQKVAGPDLSRDLDTLGSVIVRLGATDPWDQLFQWRNSALHGATPYGTIGGTVLNTAILIALDALRTAYEPARTGTLNRVQREVQRMQMGSRRSPWSFYPPY